MGMLTIALASLPGPFFGFGSGYGLGTPYFGSVFYWLRDKKHGHRAWYRWIGGFGAQIESYEFRAPKAGAEREIQGRVLVPFSEPQRRFLIVRTAWQIKEFAAAPGGPSLEVIRAFRDDLNNRLLD
jgi:hypothetical protein